MSAHRINEFTGLQSGHRGNPVVIYGSGFSGADSVQFNGVAAPYTIVADWEIIASVPSGATTGFITVHNEAGTATTDPNAFTVN